MAVRPMFDATCGFRAATSLYSEAKCSKPCGNLNDCGPGGQNGNDEE